MSFLFWIIVIAIVGLILAGLYFAPAVTLKILGAIGKAFAILTFAVVKGVTKLTSKVIKGIKKFNRNKKANDETFDSSSSKDINIKDSKVFIVDSKDELTSQ